MRIRVDPDHLREAARSLSEAANGLYALESRLLGAWNRLSAEEWEGAYRADVEARWWQARARLRTLADRADALARFLLERAARFEEADRAGMVALGQVADAFVQVQRAWALRFEALRPQARFPHALVERWLGLDGQQDRRVTAIVVPLAVRPLSSGVGIRPLRPIAPRWQGRVERAAELPGRRPRGS